MSKVVLYYNGARQHTVSAGAGCRVRLIPGQNIVSVEEYDELTEKSESFKAMLDTGELKGVDSDAVINAGSGDANDDGSNDTGKSNDLDPPEDDDDDPIVEINKLSVKDALEVIEAEVDIDHLELFLEQETDTKDRPGIIGPLVEKIEQLKAAENAGSGDANDDGSNDT